MKPTVVSFHTADEHYRQYALKLEKTCNERGLEHQITQCEAEGKDWVELVSMKPKFMLFQLLRLDTPVLWLDADAEIHSDPKLLYDTDVDFAIYARDRKKRNWRPVGREMEELPPMWPADDTRWFLTGTIFVNNTQGGRAFLRRWDELSSADSRGYQQVICQQAWCDTTPTTIWLPETYCSIYGRARPVVIRHDLASCKKRKGITVVRS